MLNFYFFSMQLECEVHTNKKRYVNFHFNYFSDKQLNDAINKFLKSSEMVCSLINYPGLHNCFYLTLTSNNNKNNYYLAFYNMNNDDEISNEQIRKKSFDLLVAVDNKIVCFKNIISLHQVLNKQETTFLLYYNKPEEKQIDPTKKIADKRSELYRISKGDHKTKITIPINNLNLLTKSIEEDKKTFNNIKFKFLFNNQGYQEPVYLIDKKKPKITDENTKSIETNNKKIKDQNKNPPKNFNWKVFFIDLLFILLINSILGSSIILYKALKFNFKKKINFIIIVLIFSIFLKLIKISKLFITPLVTLLYILFIVFIKKRKFFNKNLKKKNPLIRKKVKKIKVKSNKFYKN